MSMFKGIFSADTNQTQTFHPVTSAFPPGEQFGPLEPKDTEWAQLGGFATETQVWYHVFENGVFLFCQVIHSSIGLWTPQVQFTCKIFDPSTGEQTWKSANVSKFTSPPAASSSRVYDKRSCSSDKFKIIHSPATDTTPEQYQIDAQPDTGLQLSLTITRPKDIPGFKLGKGPRGGYSYFGQMDNPDGYVIHRFWPRTTVDGIVLHNGQALPAKGVGMFVHAIQGMRPNLVAQRWNFGHFMGESEDPDVGGVSAIMMEFTTLDQYGRRAKDGSGSGSEKIVGGVKVNVGCVVAGGKLVGVTGETQWADEAEGDKTGVQSRAIHLSPALDKQTGYQVPQAIDFVWKTNALPGSTAQEGQVEAKLNIGLGDPEKPKGLLEKVDVLAEIPYMVRKMINYATGTKPYIYQYFNPASIELTLPGKEPKTVKGTLFNEASFISNP